jgi:hypothetical protein
MFYLDRRKRMNNVTKANERKKLLAKERDYIENELKVANFEYGIALSISCADELTKIQNKEGVISHDVLMIYLKNLARDICSISK